MTSRAVNHRRFNNAAPTAAAMHRAAAILTVTLIRNLSRVQTMTATPATEKKFPLGEKKNLIFNVLTHTTRSKNLKLIIKFLTVFS